MTYTVGANTTTMATDIPEKETAMTTTKGLLHQECIGPTTAKTPELSTRTVTDGPSFRRRSRLRALFVGLLALAAPPAAATQPEYFAGWADYMESFSTFKLAMMLNPTGRRCRVWLYMSASEPFVGIEWASCGHQKYSWDGDDVRFHRKVAGVLALKPELDQIASDLWTELRAGFVNSTVTEVDQEQKGLEGPVTLEWSEVELPFAWVAGYDVYVGVSEAKKIYSLQVFKGTEIKFNARASSTYQGAQLNAAEKGYTCYTGGPPWDKNWGH